MGVAAMTTEPMRQAHTNEMEIATQVTSRLPDARALCLVAAPATPHRPRFSPSPPAKPPSSLLLVVPQHLFSLRHSIVIQRQQRPFHLSIGIVIHPFNSFGIFAWIPPACNKPLVCPVRLIPPSSLRWTRPCCWLDPVRYQASTQPPVRGAPRLDLAVCGVRPLGRSVGRYRLRRLSFD